MLFMTENQYHNDNNKMPNSNNATLTFDFYN